MSPKASMNNFFFIPSTPLSYFNVEGEIKRMPLRALKLDKGTVLSYQVSALLLHYEYMRQTSVI
jgi:hypothetical protein